MSTANQQTLAELGASDRPPILEKGNHVPWASRVLRFLDNKREEGLLIRHSIDEDACKDAQTMWARIKRLMQGTDISMHERHSRLMNEFDKFKEVDDESLTSLLNSFQPEWSKYVTMTRQKYVLGEAHYDELYDHLSQFEPRVNASKAKKAARNHDPLALVANSHNHSSHSHASPSSFISD
ncbi:hypothetical protein Tco_0817497 [Tanacetum coccineum]